MPDQRLPLPPFGKELIARLQSALPPWPIMICLGLDAWQRARQWQLNPTVWALVKVLLGYGAECVAVLPSWVDFSQSAFEYDSHLPVGERWVQVRETIVVYRLDGDSDGG